MNMKTGMRALAGFAVVGFCAAARADVIVVASGGGGQFTNLQMAVNSAKDGDTLLVRQGAYSSFTIDGKSLTVAADDGATVTVYGTVVVRNLAANEAAVLSGLVVTGATTTSMADVPGAGLVLTGNAGGVRAKSCTFRGALGIGDDATGDGSECCDLPDHHWGWDGAILDGNSGGVAFVRCMFVGGRGAAADEPSCYCGSGGPGGDALRISDGLVGLYDCSLFGGKGGSNGSNGGPGGAGARLLAPDFAGLFASDTVFQAGDGGDGYDFVFSEGGAGGDGVVLGAGTVAQFVECTSAGGVGGLACGHVFPPGPDGVAQSGGGQSFAFPVPKLVLEAPRVVQDGADVPLTIEGRPGDVAYLFVGKQTPFTATAMWRGVLLARRYHAPGTPQLVGILGEIPASGVLTTTFHLPDLAPGVQAEDWFLQVWRNSPIDGRTLGSFAPITVLDPAF